MSRWLLCGLAVAIAAVPAWARPSRGAQAWCAAHPGEVLVKGGDGLWYRVVDGVPSTQASDQLAEAWRGDLDGDGRRDLVLRHVDGCGTRECMFEAFVACGDGTYASVMAPDYGDRVRVVRQRRWARIDVRTVGEDRRPSRRYVWHALRFGVDGYR